MNEYLQGLATVESHELTFEDGMEFASVEASVEKAIKDSADLIRAYEIGHTNTDTATTEALSLALTAPVDTVEQFVSIESKGFISKAIKAVKDAVKRIVEWAKGMFNRIFNRKAEKLKEKIKKSGPTTIKVDENVMDQIPCIISKTCKQRSLFSYGDLLKDEESLNKNEKKLNDSEVTVEVNGVKVVLDTNNYKHKAILSKIHIASAIKAFLLEDYKMLYDVDNEFFYLIDVDGVDSKVLRNETNVVSDYTTDSNFLKMIRKWKETIDHKIIRLSKAIDDVERETDKKKALRDMDKINGQMKQYKGALRYMDIAMSYEDRLLDFAKENKSRAS